MKTTIILISGKSNNGKSMVADTLYSKLTEKAINTNKYRIIRSSLSTYVRDLLKNDFFFNEDDNDITRNFMQQVMELGTKVYPYHMARRVWERDNKPYLCPSLHNMVIVESFRELNNYVYYNELLKIDEITEIVTIRVNRPDFSVLKNDKLKTHVSETDLDSFEFNYTIENDGTLQELGLKTIEVMNNICEREDV